MSWDEFTDPPPPTPGERLLRGVRSIFGPRHPDGAGQVQIGDPRFDDWPVVRDFDEVKLARAWHQRLGEMGIEGVLTADWKLDRWGRGDIALRVPPGSYGDAEAALADDEGDDDYEDWDD